MQSTDFDSAKPAMALFGVFPWVKIRRHEPQVSQYLIDRSAKIARAGYSGNIQRSKQRAVWDAAGVCTVCGDKRTEGSKRCQACLDYARSKQDKRCKKSEGIGGAI